MRPIRLELEGFASFRDATEVDFADAELFVLTGATGSGKSTIIDALTFALYGSVARYDRKNLVAPAISQGRERARVRLEFEVGKQRYSATRVVHRTKNGATTREARLERLEEAGDPTTLAGSADELTSAVERLLGLGFEHFTRVVVLPQGDFAEFLHSRPKDRNDLLVRLLDLDVYRRIAARARTVAGEAEGRVTTLGERLATDLAEATPDALAAATARLDDLTGLRAGLATAQSELEDLVAAGREARAAAEAAAARLEAVRSVVRPDDVDDLAAALSAADDDLATRRADHAAAQTALDEARVAREALGDAAAPRTLLASVTDLDRLRTESVTAEAAVDTSTRDRDEAEQAARAATEAATAAEAGLDRAQTRHLAHEVARSLVAGEPCPVCAQTVATLPATEAPLDLEAARGAREAARAEAKRAAGRVTEAAAAVATAVADRDRVRAAIATTEAAIERDRTAHDLPVTVPDLQARIEAIEASDRAVREHVDAERAARDLVRAAEQARDALTARRDAAWRSFDTARDAVASLDPPPTPRDDLRAAWDGLVTWLTETAPTIEAEAHAAAAAITEAESRYRDRREAAVADCREHDIAVPDGSEPWTVVDEALGAARLQRERLERDVAQAAEVRTELEVAQRRATLARALGNHLDARHFEKWLLNRALRRLIVGASDKLRKLSSQAYSLALDDDNVFLVVDHRNADEQRSTRTLSGGETFLASLSLALALAEDVANLAAHGAARLDALFLDEGFGTLDADTLDTVAGAIEELGATGRMVGLVTHVRDLAERVPVRFEVTREPGTSRITKVTT